MSDTDNFALLDKNNKLVCCRNQRIVVDESFSYETYYDEDEELYIITTNDYASEGFEKPHCVNCGFEWHIDDLNFESC